jgi:hypothetical protein
MTSRQAKGPAPSGPDATANITETKDTAAEQVTFGYGVISERAAAYWWLSKGALRLYIKMAKYADLKTRIARPGQDRLAKELSWVDKNGDPDRRRVFRHMKELREADLVRLAGQHSLGDGRWVRKYLVAPFPGDAYIDAASPREDADVFDASVRKDAEDDATKTVEGCDQNTVSDADVFDAPVFQSSFNQPLLSSSSASAILKDANGKKTTQLLLSKEQIQKGPAYDAS